ncbi:MAG TPA: LysR family transcriptional regulator [Aliidongia sp.]|nr:LysR family transcriptional regulator [Aliidongia sp.]
MVIKQLVYLLALARERHFGAAAERSHISQPTLSAAIRQLEEELGVPIVERGNRFIGFTAEGERVLDYARRIVSDCDSLRQELGELRSGMIGQLRIGVVPSALTTMPLITVPFARAHPKVTITILSMTSIEIQSGLDDFSLEAGLTYLDNEPLQNARTLPLYREEYILLTPVDGPFAGRETVRWVEAAEVPLCLLTPDMQNRRIIDRVFRSIDREPRAVIETNSMINLSLHVGSGQWSAVMPSTFPRLFGLPVQTMALPLIEPETTHGIGIVVADRMLQQPLARALFNEASKLDFRQILADQGRLKQ